MTATLQDRSYPFLLGGELRAGDVPASGWTTRPRAGSRNQGKDAKACATRSRR